VEPESDFQDRYLALFDEITNRLEKTVRQRREEIERDLQEKIETEKKTAERKLAMIEQGVENEKKTLENFRGEIDAFKTAREALEADLLESLGRTAGYQKEAERLTILALNEVTKTAEIAKRLIAHRQSSENKSAEVVSRLKQAYGPAAGAKPEQKKENEVIAGLDGDLETLKKIKSLLEAVPPDLCAGAEPLRQEK
jgi:hypothetical protein